MTPRNTGFALALALAWAAACAHPECPDGYEKIGKICKRSDASVESARAADAAVDDANPTSADADAEGSDALDASGDHAGSARDARPTGGDANERLAEAAVEQDASDDATGNARDSGERPAKDASTTLDAAPAPECDSEHSCSAGLVCSDNACVSACAQTRCDPNATCSLVEGVPTCACNGDFVALRGASGELSCVRDMACACDANATCDVDSNQLHHCTCKPGYTGDGVTCAPVSCPSPTLANGKVTTSDGTAYFGVTASYVCDAGYAFPSKAQTITRTCGVDKSWGAAVPKCEPKDCGAPEAPRFSDGVVSGKVITTQGTTFGARADYQCNAGFSLSGVAQRYCDVDGWTGGVPKCVGCGDRVFDKNTEACDLSAPEWNAWTCTEDCQKKTIYGPCSFDADCSGAEICQIGVGCTLPCSASSDCPKSPTSNAICPSAESRGGNSFCQVWDCTSNAGCPVGLLCANAFGKYICGGCPVSMDPCGVGQTCQPMTSGSSVGWCKPN